MATYERWTDNDGLSRRFGLGLTDDTPQTTRVTTAGSEQELIVKFSFDNLPTFNADLNNDGTLNGFDNTSVGIPAGRLGTKLVSATLIATEDWATADGGTLTIGTYERDGTVIDADGIDAAIAAAALDLGDTVACDGDQVGTVLPLSKGTQYLVATVANTWTTGKAELRIKYIKLGETDRVPTKGTVTIS